MICWRYVLPRCAILIGACALLQHATPPILRWAIVESATTTGVTVEVGDVDFSLSNLRIALRDVAVADPNQPERSLLEAKRVLLDIDGASLLRKKMV